MKLLGLIGLTLLSLTALANDPISDLKAPQPLVFDLTHSAWTKILKTHLVQQDGLTYVDYRELQAQPEELNSYLESLSGVSQEAFDTWSADNQAAFWINAYNAFAIKLVTEHYPVKTIKDIGGFFSNPFKKKFFTLLGQRRGLDQIQHEILKKSLDNPRVHLALSCAARSCPPLKAQAYTGAQLARQLEEQAANFITNPKYNSLDSQAGRLRLSKIFEWFKKDFESGDKSLFAFLEPYLRLPQGQNLSSYKVSFLDFDWRLNQAKR